MADSGHLTPPPSNNVSKEKIWTETKKRLDRFLPSLFAELFPVPEAQDDASTVADIDNEASSEAPRLDGNGSKEKDHLVEQPQQPPSPSPADVD